MFNFKKSQAPASRPGEGTAGTTEGMLRSIVSALEDGLIVYDGNFEVRLANSAAEKIFGFTAGELIGKKITPEQVSDPRMQRLVQSLFPTLAPTMVPRSRSGEYPQVVDISFENPALELRTITSPVVGDGGAVTGFMKMIRDRTREISLIKAKTEFIAVASHQLRTPITGLQWGLETIAGDASLPEGLKQVAADSLTAAHQLKTIVEDLLNITKIEEGRFGYAFTPTDLNEFINKMLADILPQARHVGISLYFDPPKDVLPQVTIDATKLSMVLRNLIDNAIRYNVKNGTVTVAVQKVQDKPYVEIMVKDTGIGIPAAEAQKLFTKFFRADNAVHAVADGSGLGLYIARNIIQSHGGQIWAESELGRGSVFHFTLPTDPSLIPPREVPLEY